MTIGRNNSRFEKHEVLYLGTKTSLSTPANNMYAGEIKDNYAFFVGGDYADTGSSSGDRIHAGGNAYNKDFTRSSLGLPSARFGGLGSTAGEYGIAGFGKQGNYVYYSSNSPRYRAYNHNLTAQDSVNDLGWFADGFTRFGTKAVAYNSSDKSVHVINEDLTVSVASALYGASSGQSKSAEINGKLIIPPNSSGSQIAVYDENFTKSGLTPPTSYTSFNIARANNKVIVSTTSSFIIDKDLVITSANRNFQGDHGVNIGVLAMFSILRNAGSAFYPNYQYNKIAVYDDSLTETIISFSAVGTSYGLATIGNEIVMYAGGNGTGSDGETSWSTFYGTVVAFGYK